MKILITAPSLDEDKNVSGISTLVRGIIDNSDQEFSHFIAGRKDGERTGLGWAVRQLLLPLQLWRRIRRERPDIVHINTALVPLSILRDAVLAGVSRFSKVPVLVHPNGGRFLIEEFQSKLLEGVAARMLRVADRVIVLSAIERESLVRRWSDLDIEILPNAIALGEDSLKTDGIEKTILFLGRIHESKGLHEIVRVSEILHARGLTFKFRCFGAGPDREWFVAEMTRVLGELFHYGGVISGDEKRRELAAAHIFLLPSRYGEGLPVAMLEAMAARCVPVVADVASVRAVIRDGENGFLVRPYDVEETAEKLGLLLKGKMDWASLQTNARRTVEKYYSIDGYLRKLEAIYRAVIAS